MAVKGLLGIDDCGDGGLKCYMFQSEMSCVAYSSRNPHGRLMNSTLLIST